MTKFSKVTLLLALTLTLSLFACKDEPPADEPKIIGYITEYETNVQIPIWQTVGVPDAKAVTATANIIAGYNMVPNAPKQDMAGKIQEYHIITGTTRFEKVGTKHIVYINENATDEDIGEYLWLTVAPAVK